MNTIRFIMIAMMFTFTYVVSNAQTIDSYLKKNNLTADKTNYGLYHNIEKSGKGGAPGKGDFVKVILKGQLLDGMVFDEATAEKPFVFQLGYRQVVRGLDVGMTLFKTGGKGTLYIPAELAYGSKGVGKSVPPNAPVMYEVELLEIMSERAYEDYMIDLERKERAAFLAQKKQQALTDQKLINEYAISKKLKVQQTPSGASYVITKKGKGKPAKAGDFIAVAYEGFLLDGNSFDKSPAKKPYKFELGANKVIQGWDDSLVNFNKGAEGWLLVPSQLAYGPRSIDEGKISIPGNSVLVFKIKMTDIDRVKNVQTRK